MAKKRRGTAVAAAVATSVIGAGFVLSSGAADASDGPGSWSSVPAVTDARGVTATPRVPLPAGHRRGDGSTKGTPGGQLRGGRWGVD